MYNRSEPARPAVAENRSEDQRDQAQSEEEGKELFSPWKPETAFQFPQDLGSSEILWGLPSFGVYKLNSGVQPHY